MNKTLLRIGGAINFLFFLLHLGMVKPIGEALAPVSSDIQATASMLNIHVAFTLLIFVYFAFFRWHDLLTTRVGNAMAIAISLFWFLRAINEVVFYGLVASGMLLVGVCLVMGLLHLIPVLREWKNVPSRTQGQSVMARPAP